MSNNPQALLSKPLAPNLPSPTTYITGYDASGKSILESTRPNQWKPFENNETAFSQVYTTSFPPDLNDNKDIKFHDDLMAADTLGLARKGGVVMRMVRQYQHSAAAIRYCHLDNLTGSHPTTGRFRTRLHMFIPPHLLARLRHRLGGER